MEAVSKDSMMENQWEKMSSFKYFPAHHKKTCVKIKRLDETTTQAGRVWKKKIKVTPDLEEAGEKGWMT